MVKVKGIKKAKLKNTPIISNMVSEKRCTNAKISNKDHRKKKK